jgi:hypothetical protein
MPSRTLQNLGPEGNQAHLDRLLFTRYGTNFVYAYKFIAHLQLLRSMSLEQVIQSS